MSQGSSQIDPPTLPWMAWKPGERVVVRYRIHDGTHDALGTLIAATPHFVEIETRRGVVRVEAATMVTGKQVVSTGRKFPTSRR